MSNTNDFVIEDGVLKKYTGNASWVVVPKEVSCIAYGAFKGCESVEDIEVRSSVTLIRGGAFTGCKNLKRVYVLHGGIHTYHLDGFQFDVFGRDEGKVVAHFWYLRSNGKIYNASCRYNPVLDEEITTLEDYFITKYKGCAYLGTLENPHLVFVDAEDKDTDEIFIHSATKYIDQADYTSKMDKCALREYRRLKKITWLSTNFSKLDTEFKLMCVLGFVEADYKGEMIEDVVRNAYLKYIKSQRIKLYPLMTKNDALFYYMIKNNVVAKEYLNDIFAELQAKGDGEKMAAILPLISGGKKRSDDFEFDEISLELSVAEAKKNWLFDSEKAGVKILAYKGKEQVVTVPDTIGGKPVVSIGEYAFSPEKPRVLTALKPYLKSIVKVVLPSTVTRIENNAFEESISLEKIVIPPSLTFIGELAFKNCKELSLFEMPREEINFRNALLGCNRISNKEGLVVVNGTVITLTSKKKKTIIIDKTIEKVNLAAFSSQFDYWKGMEARVQIESEGIEVYLPLGISIHEIVKGNNRIVFTAPRGSQVHLFVENLPMEAQKYIKYEEL